jgi:hypothetical protein
LIGDNWNSDDVVTTDEIEISEIKMTPEEYEKLGEWNP